MGFSRLPIMEHVYKRVGDNYVLIAFVTAAQLSTHSSFTHSVKSPSEQNETYDKTEMYAQQEMLWI
jgi:hypothetical protein